MELKAINRCIDNNLMLRLKRTGAYLRYVAKFWDTVFDTPLRDIDQFRMYLADKKRCTLSKREQAYAERCREIVNTVYAALEEHGLIRTERTEIVTRDGLKRNGCLKYTILPIQNAIDLYHERQMLALQHTANIQKAQALAEKKGVEFHPATVSAEGGDQIGA